MTSHLNGSAQARTSSFFEGAVLLFGGDQSPLNDADADEDAESEVYVDLEGLGLDDFIESEKRESAIEGDVGSATLT